MSGCSFAPLNDAPSAMDVLEPQHHQRQLVFSSIPVAKSTKGKEREFACNLLQQFMSSHRMPPASELAHQIKSWPGKLASELNDVDDCYLASKQTNHQPEQI